MNKFILVALLLTVPFQNAIANSSEIYCTIRSTGTSLNCQWIGTDRKTMSADDISKFLNQVQVVGFITLKSRKGMERTYMVDPNSPQYKRFSDVKKSASISEINKAAAELFNEVEKKVIKVSDELDVQASAAELILYDTSITYDKMKRESNTLAVEVDGYRKNRDKICTTTPAFEQVTRANESLQKTLSNIIYAFQTPDTCLSDVKVFKDRDGTVDLRQLNDISDKYKAQCKSTKK